MNENDFSLHFLKTGSLSQTHISVFQKNIKTGLFGTTFQELIKFKSGNLFLGHPAEKTDASKFQFFEIQVLVFNYRRISISQMFENLGFVRLKGSGHIDNTSFLSSIIQVQGNHSI